MSAILKIREFFYQTGWKKNIEFPAFTISVGNISMGGTGKSPMVECLCTWAAKRKKSALVLSRGYGRRSKETIFLKAGAPVLSAEQMGDEPRMIKLRHPEAVFLVDADRAHKAKELWNECKADWVILDDAFQHWKAKRDIDIVLVDAQENLEQAALPFGRLREPASALARADILIISRANEVSAEQLMAQKKKIAQYLGQQKSGKQIWKRKSSIKKTPILCMHYKPGTLQSVDGQKKIAPDFLRGRYCILASGIAKADSFRKSVEKEGAQILDSVNFADHQFLGAEEKEKIQELYKFHKDKNPLILVTEKDLARWTNELESFPQETYSFHVELEFAAGDEERLLKILDEAEKCIEFSPIHTRER